MNRVFGIIGVLFLFSCTKDGVKTRYYFSSVADKIAKIEESKMFLFNVKDSTANYFEIKNKELIKDGKQLGIHIKLSEDSLLVFDDNKILSDKNIIKLKRFENEIDVDFSKSFWKLNGSSFDSIIVSLNNEEFVTYNGYKVIEKGNYILSNDFNDYNLFITNSARTFSDTYYLITKFNSNELVLTDMNSSKEIRFDKYQSKIDSLMFGNWSRVNVSKDSLNEMYRDGSYSCFRGGITIKKDLLISYSTDNTHLSELHYNFGLDSKIIFVDNCSVLGVKEVTKDSLILFDGNIVTPSHRILKYKRN